MEYDFEVYIYECEKKNLLEMLNNINSVYSVNFQKNGGASIRTASSIASDMNFDSALKVFLECISPIIYLMKEFDAKLRVGVFYDVKEYPFINLELGDNVISILDKAKLKLSISIYPCLDDEDSVG